MNSLQYLIFNKNTLESKYIFEVNYNDIKVKTTLQTDLKGNYIFIISFYRNKKQVNYLEKFEWEVLLKKYEIHLRKELQNKSRNKLLLILEKLYDIIKFIFRNSQAIQICFRNIYSYTICTDSAESENMITTIIKNNNIINLINPSFDKEILCRYISLHKFHILFVNNIRSLINKTIFKFITDSLNFLTFIIIIFGFILDIVYYLSSNSLDGIFNKIIFVILIPAITFGLTLSIRKIFLNSIVNRINRLLLK